MKRILLAVALFATPLYAQDAPKPAGADPAQPAKARETNTEATPPAKAAGIRWEYKTVAAFDNANEADRLAALGAEGWELVSVVYVTQLPSREVTKEGVRTSVLSNHLRYYFKRTLP